MSNADDSAIKAVTDESFKTDVLDASGPVLVDFWAEWCGPCKQIAPVLEELSQEMTGKLTFTKMNVEDNPETPGQFDVRAIPMLMLFDQGRLKAVKPGAAAKDDIATWIHDSLSAA